jgi:O-antigen/teichoic acid export membrane protein
VASVRQLSDRVTRGARSLLDPSSLLGRIGRGLSWLAVGAVGARALTLIASIWIADWLGIEGFGRYGIIQATLGTVGVFAGAGLGGTITRFVAQSGSTDARKAGEIISFVFLVGSVTGGVGSAFLFVAAPWLSTRFLADAALTLPLRVNSALILFNVLSGVQLGALAGMQAFRSIALVNLANGFFVLVSVVGGAYIAGLFGACVGLSVGGALNCVLSHGAIRIQARSRGINLSLSNIWQHRRILVTFSLPALLAGTLVDPVNWICASLLVNQPGGYRQMGAYYAANQWMQILIFVPTLVAQVIFPILSHAFSEGKRTRVSKIMLHGVVLNAAFILPLLLAMNLGSSVIMGFYGATLAAEWRVLDVTLVSAAIYAVSSPVGQTIAAAGRMWTGTIMNLAWAVSYVLLTMLLLQHGALGVAMARAIAYGLHAIWIAAYAARLIRSWKASSFT